MELILWRHAEVELGEPDEGRTLTARGHKQAWEMGDWLDRNLPERCRILVSPPNVRYKLPKPLVANSKFMNI